MQTTKHRFTFTLALMAILATSTGATQNAAASATPAQILCTPDEHSRIGLERAEVPGSGAQLFEFGGLVSIKKVGDREEYSYGKGQAFYKLKEKLPYANSLSATGRGMLLVSHARWDEGNKFMVLKESLQGGAFFHFDWDKRRYYGYVPEYGYVNAYSGSCTVLKD